MRVLTFNLNRHLSLRAYLHLLHTGADKKGSLVKIELFTR